MRDFETKPCTVLNPVPMHNTLEMRSAHFQHQEIYRLEIHDPAKGEIPRILLKPLYTGAWRPRTPALNPFLDKLKEGIKEHR